MRNLTKILIAFLLLSASGRLLFAQQDVAITVTNSNIALVKEARRMNLQKGVQQIHLVDIPSGIRPASVLVESRNRAFDVLEQNYEYDLINVGKVLEKSLDQQVQLIHPELGAQSGKLLSAASDNLMLLDDDGSLQIIPRSDKLKIYLKDYSKQKNNFITRPTLVWKVDSRKKGEQPLQISYLTGGLDWQADYVGRLNEKDTKLALACWVSVKNHSGKTFKNARLKLLAGDIQVVQRRRERRSAAMQPVAEFAKAPSFTEKSFFEYHLYTLQRKTDLKNNQNKQIQLFPETESPVKKIYRIDSKRDNKVRVMLSFKNSEENNLGLPLPAGDIRLYKSDGADLEFVGADKIEHTPRDEKLEISVGSAFDIVAERNIIKSSRPTKRSRSQTIEYKIRNHKKETVQVEVVQRLSSYQENKLLDYNHKLTEKKADYFKFKVTVKADGEATLHYEYLSSW